MLIATSTSNEGVDINGLDATILAFGRDWKFVPQTAGRVGRGSIPLVFNIWNKEHIVFSSQANKRNIYLKKNYDCKAEIIKM